MYVFSWEMGKLTFINVTADFVMLKEKSHENVRISLSKQTIQDLLPEISLLILLNFSKLH